MYEIFGEKAATAQTLRHDVIEEMVGVLSFYIVWGLMSYVLTLGESSVNARSWIFVGGLVMLLIEMNLKFVHGTQLPMTTGFAQMTTSECVSLMQSVFPLYLNGCRTLGSYLGRNMMEDNFQVSLALLQSNKAILRGLRDIHIEVQAMQRQSGGKTTTSVQGLQKRSKLDKAANKSPTKEDVATEKPEETEEDKLTKRTGVIQDPPKGKIPSFVYAVAFYLVINYFFGG